MSASSTPIPAPNPQGDISSPQAWVRLIDSLILRYGYIPGMPVIDRLSKLEEMEIDHHLAAGIDIDAACMKDNLFTLSPLFLAISKSCSPLVNALIERGASVSMRTIDSPSPPSIKRNALTWSLFAYRKHIPQSETIIRAILDVPATLSPEEINAPDHFLRTPLVLCVLKRNAMARDILVANGADATARDKDGKTILHLMASNMTEPAGSLKEEEDWLQWVIDHGVSIDAIDANGKTSVDLARQFRPSADVFSALLEKAILARTTAPAPLCAQLSPRRI